MKLGELLLAEGAISPTDLSQTLRHVRNHTRRRLGDLLVEQGFLSSSKLKRVLGVESALPYKTITLRGLWPSWQKYFSVKDLSEGMFLPLALEFNGHGGESVASIHIACVGSPDAEILQKIEDKVRTRVPFSIQKVIFFCTHPEKSKKILAALEKTSPKKGAWFLDETGCIHLELEHT